MVAIGIIGVYVVVIIFELLPIMKRKEWKKGIIYVTLLMGSLVVNLLISFGVKVTSPVKPIETVITNIFGK